MKKVITFVGLDVHKDSISVTVADVGPVGEVRHVGKIVNTTRALECLVKRLSGEGRELRFCYEAGPSGYGICRHLRAIGEACIVVAPSLIPRRPGDRVKTDRRDSDMLARMYRAGELVAVWVPDAEHEAMRDLVRAREAAVRDVRRARQRLSGFLLRHGRTYGRKAWTRTHRQWLAGLHFDPAAQRIVLEEYIDAVETAQTRRDRLSEEIAALLPDWSLAPMVAALQTMRGVALITAATVIAEVGDLGRFDSPSRLMAYLGLVPSEYTTGNRVRRGPITKTGNARVRKALVEATWSYRWPARISPTLRARHEGQPDQVLRIAWRAQTRLYRRYRKLLRAGKKPQVALTAIAREMVGFMWAIARHVAPQDAK